MKELWNKLRTKFVKIYLRKSRCQSVSQGEENFYKYFIFLEDFISHKDCVVYKTVDKKEIMQQTYDRVMGNTYENIDEDLTINWNEIINNTVDVQRINNSVNIENKNNAVNIEKKNNPLYFEIIDVSDTEELDILEGNETVVLKSLNLISFR